MIYTKTPRRQYTYKHLYFPLGFTKIRIGCWHQFKNLSLKRHAYFIEIQYGSHVFEEDIERERVRQNG